MGECHLCAARYPDERTFCPSCGVRQPIDWKTPGPLARLWDRVADTQAGKERDYPAWVEDEVEIIARSTPLMAGEEMEAIRCLTSLIDQIETMPQYRRPGRAYYPMLRRWRGNQCIKLVKAGRWENMRTLLQDDPEAYQMAISGKRAVLNAVIGGDRALSAVASRALLWPSGGLTEADVANPRFVEQHCELAMADFTEALKSDPTDAELYLGRAEALVKLGRGKGARSDFDTALRMLTRALKANPADERSLTARAFTWARLGKQENALADLKEALALAPEDGSRRKSIESSIASMAGAPAEWWSTQRWPPG